MFTDESPHEAGTLSETNLSIFGLFEMRSTPKTSVTYYLLQGDSCTSTFRIAYVTPLFRNADLDRNTLNNSLPVSNLSYISKHTENAVAKQMLKK